MSEAEPAARLWGCAERLREQFGYVLDPWERRRYDRWLSTARATLGDDQAFDRAWQEGRAMTLEQGTHYALGFSAGGRESGIESKQVLSAAFL